MTLGISNENQADSLGQVTRRCHDKKVENRDWKSCKAVVEGGGGGGGGGGGDGMVEVDVEVEWRPWREATTVAKR